MAYPTLVNLQAPDGNNRIAVSPVYLSAGTRIQTGETVMRSIPATEMDLRIFETIPESVTHAYGCCCDGCNPDFHPRSCPCCEGAARRVAL